MYRIINRYGYYEVRDDLGRFVLSADTDSEAAMEIDKLHRAKPRTERGRAGASHHREQNAKGCLSVGIRLFMD